MRTLASMIVAVGLLTFSACGDSESSSTVPATDTDTALTEDVTTDADTDDLSSTDADTDDLSSTDADTDDLSSTASDCEEPSGQEKAALRFEVRSHDRELKDSPWALVRKGGTNYMAAEIDSTGPRLVVLVSFPEDGDYLSGMKAINGTARTFTDLPESGSTVPAAGQDALDCME